MNSKPNGFGIVAPVQFLRQLPFVPLDGVCDENDTDIISEDRKTMNSPSPILFIANEKP